MQVSDHKLVYLTMICAYYYVVMLVPQVGCSSQGVFHEHSTSHKPMKQDISKQLSAEKMMMITNITVHGFLMWASMGLMMPIGILLARISSKEELSPTNTSVFFYLHVIVQMLSVLLATVGAIMSIKNLENSFNNNHQRIGLALYSAIWIQAIIGFLRPRRGKKERSGWYFVHWIIGTLISLVGIFNIYTGLEAYHKKTSRSIGLWTILFTLEVSLIAFFYLFLDKREYIQNQGVILGDVEPTTYDQAQRNNQKDSLTEPCAKRNALKNLFD